jgi:2'-5' RNA ligase
MNGDATKPGSANTGSATKQSTLRTFIAIELPTPILEALATTQEQVKSFLRAQSKEAALRWSPIKNLHLTLRFLGDTTPRQREQVSSRLQTLVATVAPFTLSVDASGRALGGFPNLRQPRVLWSGVGGDLDALGKLQAHVEAIAQAEGFAPEEKSYSPHLTLARAAREADHRRLTQVGQAIGDFASNLPASEPLAFQIDRLVFYQSELSAGGSRYIPLALLPFGA